jgi:hypothetical protein
LPPIGGKKQTASHYPFKGNARSNIAAYQRQYYLTNYICCGILSLKM